MSLEDRLSTFLARAPQVAGTAYLAPGSTVIGDVRIGPHASVWPAAVLRGDINFIQIGEGTNIQDGTVVHLADHLPAIVGDYVTVGHLAMIHACTIEDECLIGMQATVLDGAVIGRQSIIGACALVTQGTHVPPRSLVLGIPGKVVRQLGEEEITGLRPQAEKYIVVARAHAERHS